MALVHPARDRAVVSDHDGRRLDTTIRALAALALLFGVTDLSLGIVFERTGVIAQRRSLPPGTPSSRPNGKREHRLRLVSGG
jgi:hypothetical protein